MDDFLKMDVFFAVTTVAVLILTVLIGFVVVRVMRILASVERILALAEEETERVKEDIEDLRAKARREGFKLRHLLGFFEDVKKPRARSKS